MSPPSLRLIPRLFGLILGLVALSSPASGQAQVYAPGCGGINPPATVAFSGSLTPGFGSGVHLYGAPPGANIVMVVGAKNTNPDGSPIQVPLGHVDGVGATCTLNTSVLVQIPMNADANGEVHLYFTMPDYLGPQLNFQFAVREQITPKSISISQALEVKLAVTAKPTPDPLDFGTQQIGSTSTTLTMALVNDSEAPQTILDALIFDGDASDFTAVFASGATPIVIPPGGSEDIDVTFTPGMPGPRSAQMQIVHGGLPPLMSDPLVTLSGTGIESAGNEIRLNCGASDIYMDSAFNFWAADYGSDTGTQVQSTAPVEGTAEPGLYQTYREGAPVQYDLPLPDGLYEVTLHMAEFSATSTGERWIDVTVEGEKVINNFDLFGEVGQNAAYQVSFITTVADGQLDLDFKGEVGNAVVSAIEVRQQFQALLISPVTSHDFGFLGQGSSDSQGFTFQNMGTTTLHVSSIDFNVNDGAGHDFLIDMDGNQYTGGEGSTSLPATLTLAPGATAPVSVTFTPTEHGPNDVDLVFNGDFSSQTLNVVGTGGSGAHPFLHVVIEPIATAVDYDGNGFEDILLDGSFSHTHEPGADLAGFTWTEGATTLSTLDVQTVSLPVGEHTVCLTIEDDNTNPGSLIDCATSKVVTPMSVPGVNAQYYETSPSSPASMLDSLPMSPDWIEVLDGFLVDSGAAVGGSPFSTDVVAQLEADVQIDRAGIYYFATTGGADTRLFVGGAPYTGPVSLSEGSVSVEARFAVDTVADLPLEVYLALSGTPPGPIDAADLTHDESLDAPFLNAISPTKGSTAGGNLITLQGSGFFPASDVTVQWGATQLTDVDFLSITPNAISFSAPSHSAGFISVMVSTPLGGSNVLAFEYADSALPPIVFQMFNFSSVHPNKPTCAAWGPDGRLYVGNRSGKIAALTVDENYIELSEVIYTGVSNESNPEITGIAFNPFDPPSPVKLYVSHAQLYAQGGSTPTVHSPYNAEVSILTGPNFDSPTSYISGLPVSNHDHSINGLVFDNNGDLLIASGGNTNAGVETSVMGGLPESPLTGAILKAETSDPSFDGTITYVETGSGQSNDDQRDGGSVDVASGDVTVFAPGLRNSFDMALTTSGYLYATDNGPNGGLGNASSGSNSESGDAAAADELLLIEEGVYYGHPNRNRGRYDSRQNVYHDTDGPSIPGVFRQQLMSFSSSTNGIAEYRATTFGGQMQGDLIVQRWKGYTSRVELSADGRSAVSFANIEPRSDSLGVMTGPGGAILGIKYQGHKMDVLLPDDAGAVGLTAYDIFPWRAPATGGTDFVIGGENFGTLAQTSVTIGGVPAALTSVTSKRIHGILPAAISPSTDMLDVIVTSGPEQSVIPNAFRYLFVPMGSEPGTWGGPSEMPRPMGETSAGVIDGKLYVVGDATPFLNVYDIPSDTWASIESPFRPFPGSQHTAEVFDGKLYLFGGATRGSKGAVQIYDPVANQWTLGADMPWNAVSASSALIDGRIYVCGGLEDGLFTTDLVAAYDPVLDSWSTPLAPMPAARHHAASATDGEKLYIFGGRGPGSGDSSVLANGFADIQVYDPQRDAWESSQDPGSTLKPMPIGRGGAGKAVYFSGEFYIFGGETLNAPGATSAGVFDRVEVYDPTRNAWRLEASMPNARHGGSPVLFEGRIFVVGGATQSGNGRSSVMEVFRR